MRSTPSAEPFAWRRLPRAAMALAASAPWMATAASSPMTFRDPDSDLYGAVSNACGYGPATQRAFDTIVSACGQRVALPAAAATMRFPVTVDLVAARPWHRWCLGDAVWLSHDAAGDPAARGVAACIRGALTALNGHRQAAYPSDAEAAALAGIIVGLCGVLGLFGYALYVCARLHPARAAARERPT